MRWIIVSALDLLLLVTVCVDISRRDLVPFEVVHLCVLHLDTMTGCAPTDRRATSRETETTRERQPHLLMWEEKESTVVQRSSRWSVDFPNPSFRLPEMGEDPL